MIEGIPDGWELVRIGKPFINERYISLSGRVTNCVHIPSGEAYAIVRKIKKPKKFRPFANAAEAEPFFDRRLKYKNHSEAILRIGFMSRIGVEIGRYIYSYKEAYECLECIDGTPFGIEVTE